MIVPPPQILPLPMDCITIVCEFYPDRRGALRSLCARTDHAGHARQMSHVAPLRAQRACASVKSALSSKCSATYDRRA